MGRIFAAKAVLKPWQPKPRFSANAPKTKHEENDLQMMIARHIKTTFPDAIFLSSGNGINKTKAQAGIWKAINSENGQPDMLILFPSQGYHGLAMELKKEGYSPYKKDGTLKREMKPIMKRGVKIGEYNHLERQEKQLIKLNELGYLARFVCGYADAIRLIDGYMGIPKNAELF